MYPQRREDALRIFGDTVAMMGAMRGIRVAICPPFVWLPVVSSLAKSTVWLGAQDSGWADEGAFTGEISPTMLKNIGCRLVIVGHSERRTHVAESQEIIRKKTVATLRAGLFAVLCVGEQQREGEWEKEILEQTRSAIADIAQDNIQRLLIAYEPVWAVGTGKADSPKDTVTSILLVRRVLKDKFGAAAAEQMPVLYGGSINAQNIHGFAVEPEIGGFLVGHGSLDAGEFSKIVMAARLKEET